MSPIRVGFVGLSSTGWASISLAPPLLSSPLSSHYTITALSTSSPESAQLAAEKYTALSRSPQVRVKPYHGSTASIASDTDVDLIVVSVKTPDHKKALAPAIEKGKDIFVEWPLGNGLEEAKELAGMARAKGVRTMVGMQGWQVPEVKKMKELIQAGRIGRVLSSTFIGSKPSEVPYWAPFTGVRDAYCVEPENGATYADILIGHNLSTIIHALGPLTSLSATSTQLFPTIQFIDSSRDATGEPIPSPLPDQYSLSGILRDSGALFSATWRGGISSTGEKNGNDSRPTMIWTIDGDEGWIRMESTGPGGSVMHVNGIQKVWLNGELIDVEKDGLNNSGRAFMEFAKGDEKGVYPTFDDALVVHKHVEAVKTSSTEGRRVYISSL